MARSVSFQSHPRWYAPASTSGSSGSTEDVMPQTPHIERHFTANDSVRDMAIGMSDGLTMPFALAAGLSGAVGSTRLVVGSAGGIAMGLGGYLAARSEAEHYTIER